MTALLCIRHAQSTMNAAGLWQGQADPPLSEEGRSQARRLAERLAEARLQVLVASDLARARETAEIVGARIGLRVVLHPGLREMDVGSWSGLPHAEIRARWPDAYARFRAGCEELQPGGGESRRELRARVGGALGQIRAGWPDGRVGVVTHMGVLRTLRVGIQLENAGMFWLGSGAPAASAPSGVAVREGEIL